MNACPACGLRAEYREADCWDVWHHPRKDDEYLLESLVWEEGEYE